MQLIRHTDFGGRRLQQLPNIQRSSSCDKTCDFCLAQKEKQFHKLLLRKYLVDSPTEIIVVNEFLNQLISSSFEHFFVSSV